MPVNFKFTVPKGHGSGRGESLLGASSADKLVNCADFQSEEWKERSKRGNFASHLIHLFYRKAHEITHRSPLHSWLTGRFKEFPQFYSHTGSKHLTFTSKSLLSIKKAAPIDWNLYLSPCENFHLNKPAERLVYYPLSCKVFKSHLRPWGLNASKQLFQL